MIDTGSVRKFAASLRKLSQTLANRIAERAAPVITEFAQTSFESSTDPYGVAWVPSVDGKTVTLRDTGSLSKFIRYVAIGSKLRVALGVPYAKYQIGLRPVFPAQGKPLPPNYSETLAKIAAEEIAAAAKVQQ